MQISNKKFQKKNLSRRLRLHGHSAQGAHVRRRAAAHDAGRAAGAARRDQAAARRARRPQRASLRLGDRRPERPVRTLQLDDRGQPGPRRQDGPRLHRGHPEGQGGGGGEERRRRR